METTRRKCRLTTQGGTARRAAGGGTMTALKRPAAGRILMLHRFARRGTAVLMLVLSLALAGARPAAAQPAAAQADPFRVAIAWLAGLWQAATASTGTAATPDGDRGAGLDPNGLVDRGAGLDPNGDAPAPAPDSAP
jgi:hypothetical protein